MFGRVCISSGVPEDGAEVDTDRGVVAILPNI